MGGRLCTVRVNKLEMMERVTKSKLVSESRMNRRRSQFFSNDQGQLWKLHLEDSKTEATLTISNIRMVMDLPCSDYILRPTIVRRVGVNTLAMCMPRGRVDLYEAMKRPMQWKDIVNNLEHLARGVHWLHDQGVAHRDIKPENAVLDNGVFKWIDFDYSSLLTEWVHCGSRNFTVPIIVSHRWRCSNEERSRRMDVYAFGKLILVALWRASRHGYFGHEKYLYNMFQTSTINNFAHQIKGEAGVWTTCALQCCQFFPPRRIPLPTTKPDATRAADTVTIRTHS